MLDENQKVENKSLLVEKFKYQQFKRKNVDGQRYYVMLTAILCRQ